ncbi:MAG: hypothetical protein ABJH98_03055 [Reichenbachiella sp.]|uniref:hypothetical protein n=1 Tax=Reichenbachiella sp. TaxID=2184521 RepID=UPI00329875B6
MKEVISIFFCFLLSLPLAAHTEKTANNNTGGSGYESEKTEEAKELESNNEAESVEKSENLDAEPDSSYYSVNKFNFLFYFVYKMKYMDNEAEVETPTN